MTSLPGLAALRSLKRPWVHALLNVASILGFLAFAAGIALAFYFGAARQTAPVPDAGLVLAWSSHGTERYLTRLELLTLNVLFQGWSIATLAISAQHAIFGVEAGFSFELPPWSVGAISIISSAAAVWMLWNFASNGGYWPANGAPS